MIVPSTTKLITATTTGVVLIGITPEGATYFFVAYFLGVATTLAIQILHKKYVRKK